MPMGFGLVVPLKFKDDGSLYAGRCHDTPFLALPLAGRPQPRYLTGCHIHSFLVKNSAKRLRHPPLTVASAACRLTMIQDCAAIEQVIIRQYLAVGISNLYCKRHYLPTQVQYFRRLG